MKNEKITIKYPNRGTFIAYVTNNGNSEEKVEVITPAPLRQWSVDVVPNDFKLQPGETKEIEIRVTPPVGLKDDDTYKFTIIIQPEDTPVAGEPIELIVNADTSTISLVNDFVKPSFVGIKVFTPVHALDAASVIPVVKESNLSPMDVNV